MKGVLAMRTWGLLRCSLLAATASAQVPLPPPSVALSLGMQPVIGEPYTAERVLTTYRILADGSKIDHKITMLVARDSQGRTYMREELHLPGAKPGASEYGTHVYDPATRTETVWRTSTSEVSQTYYAKALPQPPPPADPGPRGIDRSYGAGAQRVIYHAEEMPPQVIEGVMTQGVKSIRTVPAGVAGNDRDRTSTTLTWYCPELRFVVTTIYDDPVTGVSKLEFTNLKRVEPDPAIFRMPEGYAVRATYTK